MKRMLIFVMFVVLGLSAYSFEILGIKSGMSKVEVKEMLARYKNDEENRNPFIDYIKPWFDHEEKLYKVDVYTDYKENLEGEDLALFPALLIALYGDVEVLDGTYAPQDARYHKKKIRYTLVDEELETAYDMKRLSDLSKKWNW